MKKTLITTLIMAFFLYCGYNVGAFLLDYEDRNASNSLAPNGAQWYRVGPAIITNCQCNVAEIVIGNTTKSVFEKSKVYITTDIVVTDKTLIKKIRQWLLENKMYNTFNSSPVSDKLSNDNYGAISQSGSYIVGHGAYIELYYLSKDEMALIPKWQLAPGFSDDWVGNKDEIIALVPISQQTMRISNDAVKEKLAELKQLIKE